jgi:hypothetical protein
MPEPHLRASDADRNAVAEVLGTHMSAGRLTVAEYDERLARAYAARTYGELDELTTDLPGTPPAAAARAAATGGAHSASGSVPGRAPNPWRGHGLSACAPWTGGAGLRAAWASWATTAAIVLSIWLLTSMASTDWIYPWPIWVIGPWGAVLLAQSVSGSRGRTSDRHLQEGPRR